MVLTESGLCVPSNPKSFYFYENEQKLSGYILQASSWLCGWLLRKVQLTHASICKYEVLGLSGNVK